MFQVPGIYIYIYLMAAAEFRFLESVPNIYIYIFEIYVGKIVIGHVIGAD